MRSFTFFSAVMILTFEVFSIVSLPFPFSQQLALQTQMHFPRKCGIKIHLGIRLESRLVFRRSNLVD